MALRMTPLSTITGRFHRLAHDLAESTGKPFDLQIVGEETELDKSLIEKLAEPLMHILRNAVDHGLETPEGRAAAGKPARGLVVIEARHSGADILIGISDDGRGLNPDMIRERAIENGLISPTDQLSRDHLLSLILEPGFSTATQVTELSGRGIGTDVVNTMVRSMRGQVIIDTEEGQGTRFILRLPLTLAIVDGLLVQVGPERYVIPLAAVSAILDMPLGLDFGDSVAKVLPVRGELVSVLSLRRTFGIDAPPAEHPKMILVQSGEGHVGISVDRIIRVEQTVVKQLSPLHREVHAFGGASVQPDGQIALILDVAALGHMHGRRAIRPSVEVPA
jgi:two-component system chemotaxis sensor kinase CheA